MLLEEILERKEKGIITVFGKRSSGKTLLSLFFLKKKENYEKFYLFSDFLSLIIYLKKIKNKIKNINFVQINSIEEIKEFFIEIAKKYYKRKIIVVIDRISLIFRIEASDSISSYVKFMSIISGINLIINNTKGIIIFVYTSEFFDKALNILKYWSDIMIEINREKDILNLKTYLLNKNKQINEKISIKYIINKLSN